MKRRFPWGLLVVAFLAVPILEIYVLIQVGQVIGPWWTILLLIADSVIGSWIIRREGRKAWRALTEAITAGRMPARELADGVLIVVGGTLMVSPGFVTDVFGILAILPVTRPLARAALTRFLARRLPPPTSPTGFRGPGPNHGPHHGPGGDVVPGEVID